MVIDQLNLLWLLVAAEGVLLVGIVLRLGGFAVLFQHGDSRGALQRLVGRRLPPLRVEAADMGERPVRFTMVVDDVCLLLFVMSRCVASMRFLRALESRLDAAVPSFRIVVVLMSPGGDARRFIANQGITAQVLILRDRSFLRKFREMGPFGVALGCDGRVLHIGSVDSGASVRQFREACGLPAARDWLSNGRWADLGSVAEPGTRGPGTQSRPA